MKKITLLTAFAAICSMAVSQTVTTDTLNWSGGWCTMCIGSAGNYSCTPPYSGSQNWNNGERTFIDPLPVGDTVTQVSVRVYYNTGVGIKKDSIQVELNGVNVGTAIPLASDTLNTCGACHTFAVSKISSVTFPGYLYGGTNTVKIIPYDSMICVSQAIITLNGPPVLPMSISQAVIKGFLDLKIYPNPATRQFFIEMNVPKKIDFKIELFNVQGQLVSNKNINEFEGKYKGTVDIESIAKGVYTFRIVSQEGSIDKKVLVE